VEAGPSTTPAMSSSACAPPCGTSPCIAGSSVYRFGAAGRRSSRHHAPYCCRRRMGGRHCFIILRLARRWDATNLLPSFSLMLARCCTLFFVLPWWSIGKSQDATAAWLLAGLEL
jgi:hypothetical protein